VSGAQPRTVQAPLEMSDHAFFGHAEILPIVHPRRGRPEQNVAELQQNDFGRRQRLNVPNNRRPVGVVQDPLERREPCPVPISLQVAEDGVFVLIEDPVVQNLIVKLVEPQLCVAIVQAEVHGLVFDSDAAESQVETEAHEEIDEIGVEAHL